MKTRREFLAESAVVAAGAALWPAGATASPTVPNISFPTNSRDRIAVASYPFRDFILPAVYVSASASSTAPKMELTEFAAHVKSRFHVNKIEPWSSHFRSLEPKYLEQFRTALENAQVGIADIAYDGEHSFYASDRAIRDRAIAANKQWIDAASTLASPSLRTHVATAPDNQPPDVERAADTLRCIAEYAATRNVVVNLENDDGVTEDPVFLVKVIEKVNSPWLRALPDFANSLMHKVPEDAYTGLEAMFQHAYSICHVKPSESTEKGANVLVDLPYAFGILKKSGFRGYCSMEYDNTGDPYRETEELIEKTVRALG